MFWYAMQSRLNMTLQPWEGMGREEKAALKRAEEAERAFRASKGYSSGLMVRRDEDKCLVRMFLVEFVCDIDSAVKIHYVTYH